MASTVDLAAFLRADATDAQRADAAAAWDAAMRSAGLCVITGVDSVLTKGTLERCEVRSRAPAWRLGCCQYAA